MCSCLLNCAWWPKTGQELCKGGKVLQGFQDAAGVARCCRVGRGWSWRCALSPPYLLAQTTPCKTSASPCQKCLQLYWQVDWGLIILQCVPRTPKIQDWYVSNSFSHNIATVPTAISHYYRHCHCHHQGERRNAVVALEWCVLCQEEEGGDLIARRVSPLYNDHCTGLDSASDWV